VLRWGGAGAGVRRWEGGVAEYICVHTHIHTHTHTHNINLSQDARAEEEGTGGAVSQDEAKEEHIFKCPQHYDVHTINILGH